MAVGEVEWTDASWISTVTRRQTLISEMSVTDLRVYRKIAHRRDPDGLNAGLPHAMWVGLFTAALQQKAGRAKFDDDDDGFV